MASSRTDDQQQLLAVDALWNVDTGKVLFLEVDSAFADFLCHLLRQPLGTVADFLRRIQMDEGPIDDDDGSSSSSSKSQKRLDGSPSFVRLFASMLELKSSLFRPDTAGAKAKNTKKSRLEGMLIYNEQQPHPESSSFVVSSEDIFGCAGNNQARVLCSRPSYSANFYGINQFDQRTRALISTFTLGTLLERISTAVKKSPKNVYAPGIKFEDVFQDCQDPFTNNGSINASIADGYGYVFKIDTQSDATAVSANTIIDRANAKACEFHAQLCSPLKMTTDAEGSTTTSIQPAQQIFRDNLQFLISPKLKITPSSIVNAFSLLTAGGPNIGSLRSTRISITPPLLARLLTNMMNPSCESVFDGLIDKDELKKGSRLASMCGDEPFTEVSP